MVPDGPTDRLENEVMTEESIDQTLMVALSANEATKLVLLAAAECSSTLSNWEEADAARVQAALEASTAWTARGAAKKEAKARAAGEAAESMKAALPHLGVKFHRSLLFARAETKGATKAIKSAQSTGVAQEPALTVATAIVESATNVLDSVGSAMMAMSLDVDANVTEFMLSKAAESALSARAAAKSAWAATKTESAVSTVAEAANSAVGVTSALQQVLLSLVAPADREKMIEWLRATDSAGQSAGPASASD